MKRLFWATAILVSLCCLVYAADINPKNFGTASSLTGTEEVPVYQTGWKKATLNSILGGITAKVDSLVAAMTSHGVTMPPTLSLDKTTLAFGNVSSSSTRQGTFTITNTGFRNLSTARVVGSGDNIALFGNVSSACRNRVIAVNGTCTTTVTYTPGGAGDHTASVALYSNDPAGVKNVALTGTGTSSAGITEDFASCSDWTNYGGGDNGILCTGGVGHGSVNEADNKAYYTTGTGSINHWVRATTFVPAPIGGIRSAGFMVRRTSGGYYNIIFDGTGHIFVQRSDGLWDYTSTGTYSANASYDVKVEVSGTTPVAIKVYVTNMATPVVDTTDSSAGRLQTGEHIGATFARGNGDDPTLDNLTAGAL